MSDILELRGSQKETLLLLLKLSPMNVVIMFQVFKKSAPLQSSSVPHHLLNMVYCEEKVLVKLLPPVRKNLKWLYFEGLLLPLGEHLFLCFYY